MAKNFVSNKDESVRMFEHPILDVMSRVHWSTPLVFWVPVVLYCLYAGIAGGTGWFTPLIYAAALAFWTLAEYILHRFIFHYEPTSSWGKRLHFLSHGVHHDYPNDSKRLVMPPLLAAPLAATFFALFYVVLGSPVSYVFFAGFLTGYLIYDMMHYALHHSTFDNAFWREMKQHHMIHHYHDPEHGFGVSSKMWDYVFRTTFNIQKKDTTSVSGVE